MKRIVVTVCPRERGTVRLPIERRGRVRRLDAAAVLRELSALVVRRGLGECVRVRDGCAGGCALRGPNVTVTIYSPLRPEEPPDHVAIGRKSYVGALGGLDCLARLVMGGARRTPQAPRRSGPGVNPGPPRVPIDRTCPRRAP